MLWRRRASVDFAAEIESHLQLEADRLQSEGMSPDEARAAARRAFGSVTSARERFHQSGRVLWLDHLFQDVRAASRSLARSPIASAVAIASLAGGIGTTTATLTVRSAVFRNAPPLYRDAEQLLKLTIATPERPHDPVPGDLYLLWRDNIGAGIQLAAAAQAGSRDLRMPDGGPTAVPVRAVTPELFEVLGVSPSVGSAFGTGTSVPRESAMLSHRIWRSLFDGRSDIVGQAMWIDDQPYVVRGVMPKGFWFSTMDAPVWTPLEIGAMKPDERLEVIARRAPGIAAESVVERLQRATDEYTKRLPEGRRQLRVLGAGIEGTPLAQSMALVIPWLVATSVLLTLLIACANVAILMFARWTAREREIAIRASLAPHVRGWPGRFSPSLCSSQSAAGFSASVSRSRCADTWYETAERQHLSFFPSTGRSWCRPPSSR